MSHLPVLRACQCCGERKQEGEEDGVAHRGNQKSMKSIFTFTAIRRFLTFVSDWVPAAAAAAPSGAGRACRYSLAAAAAEVEVREQSHNLKILPALPPLSPCHRHCASPVPRPALNSHFSTLLFYVLHSTPSPPSPPCVVCRSQFGHTLCQRCVGPAEQIHFGGYFAHNMKGEYKI